MPSFSRHRIARAITLAGMVLVPSIAEAQQVAQGFAVERFYPSAPGGGWFVMDTLDMHGGLGGTLAISSGYAYRPLQVATPDGAQHLAVVSDEAFADLGVAVTYDRYRVSMNMTSPLVVAGQDGSVGSTTYKAPSVDVGTNTDLISDVRIGLDARLFGTQTSAFRLGASAQLFVPSGDRSEYDTDGTYRAMGRVLFAGDLAFLSYAGQVGLRAPEIDFRGMCGVVAKIPLTGVLGRRTLDEDADPEPQRARPPRCEAAPPIVGRLSGRSAKGSSKRPGTASTCLSPATLGLQYIQGDDRLRRGRLVWMVASRRSRGPRKTPGKP